eukprot:15456099-Alexandrium_andersonii.AAC.1
MSCSAVLHGTESTTCEYVYIFCGVAAHVCGNGNSSSSMNSAALGKAMRASSMNSAALGKAMCASEVLGEAMHESVADVRAREHTNHVHVDLR